jgi:hypothetical protein
LNSCFAGSSDPRFLAVNELTQDLAGARVLHLAAGSEA